MDSLIVELIQISIGTRDRLSRVPSEQEWEALFEELQHQSIVGLIAGGFENVPQEQRPSKEKLLQLIGTYQLIEGEYLLHCKRAQELYSLFIANGIKSCILKGVGIAQLYKTPSQRQLGDIDILIDCNREVFLKWVSRHDYKIKHVDIKHSDICFFNDVPVEVHFMPSWLYCPWNNKTLQNYFNKIIKSQFENYSNSLGFAHTTVGFDLVYSLVHIYRHVFEEGIGLRHIVDYYYILQNSSETERNAAFKILKQLQMAKFAGGIMWILKQIFDIDNRFVFCPINKRNGEFLFREIALAGNFGHYDSRIKKGKHYKNRIWKGVLQLKRNLRFLVYYPSEVIWSPLWKMWHWGWRKKKGYL